MLVYSNNFTLAWQSNTDIVHKNLMHRYGFWDDSTQLFQLFLDETEGIVFQKKGKDFGKAFHSIYIPNLSLTHLNYCLKNRFDEDVSKSFDDRYLIPCPEAILSCYIFYFIQRIGTVSSSLSSHLGYLILQFFY